MPNVGLIRLRDAETGESVMLDTSSRATRRAYRAWTQQRADQRDTLFRSLRLDPIHIDTGEDFVEPLQRFFRRRELRK
jgi:hypothetical protein